mmetsp:Transcript_54538/g.62699  ORF Transcript_54538/g.62699 Transcript_54538/m.62699 type:complete len:177 (-) Transcript_54538:59-589(-)
MLRLSLRLLADPPAAASSSSMVTAGGRLIAVRKKAKWIDRRSKKIPHNGKDVYLPGEQPSCALCHVRFRYKQDYQAHKDSELHTNRMRWAETQAWWKETGEPALLKREDNDWEWYATQVLPIKAAEEGITVDEASRKYRRAIMIDTPRHHRMIQPPTVKAEIKEPRDQRWPNSPKW